MGFLTRPNPAFPALTMDQRFRHQCLIYQGSPSRQLASLAAVMAQMLAANYRCLYLNSPAMVAGMSSCLAAQGVDVACELAQTRLLLSSDQSQLYGGGFDVEKMIARLDGAIVQALKDGYKGLWATGDMSWEFGSEKNLPKLLRYERRLEELFRRQPTFCGICQYHSDLLPHEVLRQGLLTHRGLFVNETLSRINPHYDEAEPLPDETTMNLKLDETISKLREIGYLR
jgi:MEDS: MEthanogen/methylotroph, DcmR Sensory domain